MPQPRKCSDNGKLVLKEWEAGPQGGSKPALVAYNDNPKNPAAGKWTIGYGHTTGVAKGLTCIPAQAEAWVADDLLEAEQAVQKLVKVNLNDNQFAALCLLVFNIGVAGFKQSTLLRLLNAGDFASVPSQMLRWVYDNGKKVTGLINRRNAEIKLWNKGL